MHAPRLMPRCIWSAAAGGIGTHVTAGGIYFVHCRTFLVGEPLRLQPLLHSRRRRGGGAMVTADMQKRELLVRLHGACTCATLQITAIMLLPHFPGWQPSQAR